MKIVAWNVRGPTHPNFVSQIRKVLKNVALDILFLSKTKINANKTLNIFPKLSIQLL